MRRVGYLRWLAPPVASAFLLVGCGVLSSGKTEPAPITLSHGRFVYLADRACRRFLRGGVRRGKATTFATARLNFDKALSADERMLVVLNGLAPPASDAAAYRRFLAAADEQDLLLHRLRAAVDAAEQHRVKTLAGRLKGLGDEFDTRAARVGLRVCARA